MGAWLVRQADMKRVYLSRHKASQDLVLPSRISVNVALMNGSKLSSGNGSSQVEEVVPIE